MPPDIPTGTPWRPKCCHMQPHAALAHPRDVRKGGSMQLLQAHAVRSKSTNKPKVASALQSSSMATVAPTFCTTTHRHGQRTTWWASRLAQLRVSNCSNSGKPTKTPQAKGKLVSTPPILESQQKRPAPSAAARREAGAADRVSRNATAMTRGWTTPSANTLDNARGGCNH